MSEKETEAGKLLGELEAKKAPDNTNEAINVSEVIADLIKTDFGGSNEEQGKAVQLLKGLAFSDDPLSDKFMKAISDLTSKMNPDDFKSGSSGNGGGEKPKE